MSERFDRKPHHELYIVIVTMGDDPLPGMKIGQRMVIEICEGEALFSAAGDAQDICERCEYGPTHGSAEDRATFQILCASDGADVTQRAIVETVQTYRRMDPQYYTKHPAPAWWQEHDPTLCAWELDDYEEPDDETFTRETHGTWSGV